MESRYEKEAVVAYPDFTKEMSGAEELSDLTWMPEAVLMLRRIPFFARSQARLRTEELARASEVYLITVELVQQARLEFGQ
jgi:Proto-chlorophyllide reductase 57 kD subunit